MNITDGHGICMCKLGMNNVVYILKCNLKHRVLLCKNTLEKTSGAQSSSGTDINIVF